MQKDEKRDAKATAENDAPRGRRAETPEAYEPPRLLKFDKLEKLIVSGE
jgi:hypothetical protein